MASSVKGTRRYVSPRRDQQAQETRRQIVAAAAVLLAERGYANTTIDAIADAAGVAVQTIYTSVGNKRAVLWAVLEGAVAGDDAPRTVLQRFRAELAGVDDPRERLHRATRFGRRLMERSVDVRRLMRDAAAADTEVAAAVREAENLRHRDATHMVRVIVGERGFAVGMDARTAADLWFALTSYELYELLVRDRGWSVARYEKWITRTLEVLLP